MTNFYDFKIEKIKNLSSEEKNLRKKNLNLFFQNGFPNKKNEDWKFTDLNSILGKNFNNIANKNLISEDKKLETIKNFEHNLLDGHSILGSRTKTLRPHLLETSRIILPSCPPPKIPRILFSPNIVQK